MWLLDLWVFVTVLLLLVSSEDSVFVWVFQHFTTLEDSRVESVAFTCSQKIHGVFVSLFKIFLFHGTFSGLSLFAFELSYPCSIALLSAIMALIDERLSVKLLLRVWGPTFEFAVKLILVATFLDDSFRAATHFAARLPCPPRGSSNRAPRSGFDSASQE